MKNLIEKYLAELTSLSDESQWTAEYDMRDWGNGIAILRYEHDNERCRSDLSTDDLRMLDSIRDKYLGMLHEDATAACSAGYGVEWERGFMSQLEKEYMNVEQNYGMGGDNLCKYIIPYGSVFGGVV